MRPPVAPNFNSRLQAVEVSTRASWSWIETIGFSSDSATTDHVIARFCISGLKYRCTAFNSIISALYIVPAVSMEDYGSTTHTGYGSYRHRSQPLSARFRSPFKHHVFAKPTPPWQHDYFVVSVFLYRSPCALKVS